MLTDGRMLDAAVGELVWLDGLDVPILVRLSPEFLRQDRRTGQYYYQSITGPLLIEPGNATWVLFHSGIHDRAVDRGHLGSGLSRVCT
jgi:hypothetical protein